MNELTAKSDYSTENQENQENIEECGYTYKFSVVMPVYKVEEYIREAVDSLINQTIGFEKNIQLILVDDGSPDKSGEICDEYKEKYPDNIIVIHKENGGVSSARNAGLQYITGRYVNFLDSDDKVSANAFASVYKFFSQNEEYIDIVSIPITLFEAQSGPHILNYKFDKGTRIINLRNEYTSVQLSLASSFIKLSKAKQLEFDTNLSVAEDAKEIARLLIDKQHLGVVTGCKYNYRKRTGDNLSALQNSSGSKNWYLSSMQHFSLWVYNFYTKNLGYIPFYVQYTIMYDIQWKIKTPDFPKDLLTDKEKEEFFEILKQIIIQTDDKIIMEQKSIYIEYKYFLMFLKYNRHADILPRRHSALLAYNNTNIKYMEDNLTQIDFIELNNSRLKIEGYMVSLGDKNIDEIFLLVNEEEIKADLIERTRDKFSLGNLISWITAFSAEIPLNKANKSEDLFKIQVCCKISGDIIVKKKSLTFGQFTPIVRELKNSYWFKDGYKLTTDGNTIYLKSIEKHRFINHAKAEYKLLRELWKKKKTPGARRAVAARLAYYLLKPFKRKDIWLISDRINKADDNGEAFFRYMAKKRDRKVKYYFAINKNSPDMTHLKKIGKVIDFARWRYKFYLLFGGITISSHADDIYIKPFQTTTQFYKDLLHEKKYVFLQHGVIKDDLSDWLNKYNKNFDLFVTASNQEYNSIFDCKYYYNKNQIILTGLPRHDFFENSSKKYITVMPTWRKYFTQYNLQKGTWIQKEGFINSQYYLFYNNLLNHPDLLSEAKKHGYTICFMPHPNMQSALNLFEKNDSVIFFDLSKSYREIFAESDMMITDYSSVAFDFAYLRKPLIYCQFDSEKFFSGEHTYTKGYFDYERDGFGEVETTLEETTERIIEYIKSSCALKEKYLNRIDSTFAFNDKNSCERVYNAIKKLK